MTTTSITREYRWEMGHALLHHKGKCYRPHGHNYRMEIEVSGAVQDDGMVSGVHRGSHPVGPTSYRDPERNREHDGITVRDNRQPHVLRLVVALRNIYIVGGQGRAAYVWLNRADVDNIVTDANASA